MSVRLFADLRRFLHKGGDGPRRCLLPVGATVQNLLSLIRIRPDEEITAGLNGELAQRDAFLHDGEVEFRDASHLRGKVTGDVREEVIAELGDPRIKVAQIGPAGERLVRFACLASGLNEGAGCIGMGRGHGLHKSQAGRLRPEGTLPRRSRVRRTRVRDARLARLQPPRRRPDRGLQVEREMSLFHDPRVIELTAYRHGVPPRESAASRP